MKWAIQAVALLLMITACEKTPIAEPTVEVGSVKVSANLFPEATEVWMYVNQEEISVDDQGRLPDGSFPARGIALTTAEINALRGAVHYVSPPSAAYACCVPRHAFLFYDKRKHFLGALTVCFECACANLTNAPDPPEDKYWLIWDRETLERIVTAHDQPIEFAPPQ